MRKANVFMHQKQTGYLSETEVGYQFMYDKDYLQMPGAEAISLTFPLSDKVYINSVMFPFFDGLIPEGWLLEVAEQNWKLSQRDRMGLLLACCRDCIGAVSIVDAQNDKI